MSYRVEYNKLTGFWVVIINETGYVAFTHQDKEVVESFLDSIGE